jgi:hypothetical protein
MGLFRPEVGFYPVGELAAGKHHPAPAAQAFDLDVSPQTDHPPAVFPAGVCFPELEDIVEF